jgi:hypothetical protein
MQFPQSPLLKVLLGGRNVMTGRQIRDNLLPRPAAIEDLRFRITETPLEVHDKPIIRALCREVVWVLQI